MALTRRSALALALAAGVALPAAAQDKEPIKIGALATLEGAFTVMGEDGLRGVRMAIDEYGGEINGHPIELVTASSDASPDSAVRAARKLVEQDGVDILIGPLSGSEGLAIKDYAKTQPDVTFLNGSSAAQDTTLRDPAENFYRFSTDGAQWMAGLGEYLYNEKGYRNLAVVAEDYSFPYTQVFGVLEPFCRLGGKAPAEARFWVPIGNKDYSSIIAALPFDVDAIYVALGGADAVNFLSQYEQAGGDLPLVAGSITVDQTVLGTKGKAREYILGTPSAGPISDTWDDPEWQAFVDRYNEMFPDAFQSPSLFFHAYYVNTKAALEALEQIDGDLKDGHEAFRQALDTLELDTPTGTISVDERRQAVADIFLTEVVEGPDGTMVNETVKVIPAVSQTMGQPYEKFLEYGPVSRTNPVCE